MAERTTLRLFAGHASARQAIDAPQPAGVAAGEAQPFDGTQTERAQEEVRSEHRTIEVPVRKEVVIIERRLVSGRPDAEAKER